MIYFSFYEILKALVAFFVLGCLFGGFYNCMGHLILFFKELILIPKSSYLKYKKIPYKYKKTRQNSFSNITLFFIDFIFIFIFGISFILLSYIVLDGDIRMYSLLLVFIGYVLSLKVLGAFFPVLISKLSNIIIIILKKLFFIILYPLFFLCDNIIKLISPIIKIITNRYKILKFRLLVLQKKKQIEKFFT